MDISSGRDSVLGDPGGSGGIAHGVDANSAAATGAAGVLRAVRV
jgi:hypothetical protein